MHSYTAQVYWKRGDQGFTDGKYSRAHEWRFDGGTVVPASASPSVVPVPYSVPSHVDPEEAVVAAASSCHMLWFLSIAAKAGFTVEDYRDFALGELGKGTNGRTAFSRIILRPVIRFSGDRVPTKAQIEELHNRAHDACFIANSLRAEVVVKAGTEGEPAEVRETD